MRLKFNLRFCNAILMPVIKKSSFHMDKISGNAYLGNKLRCVKRPYLFNTHGQSVCLTRGVLILDRAANLFIHFLQAVWCLQVQYSQGHFRPQNKRCC